jgi:Ca2+-binding RTX toxin-like protein
MTIVLETSLTIAPGEVYASTGGPTFYVPNSPRDFLFHNLGTIHATGPNATAFHSFNAFGQLVNEGLIKVESEGFTVGRGIYGGSWLSSVLNIGRIEVTAHFADGLKSFDHHQIFDNRGVLTVRGSGTATGVWMINGGSFSNTGRIDVAGGNAIGVVFDHAEDSFDHAGDGVFQNRGEIVVGPGSNNFPSYGVKIHGLSDRADAVAPNVINHGLIQADVALYTGPGGVTGEAIIVQIVANHGVIIGAVHLDNGDDQFLNYGSLTGDLLMGNGEDFVDLSRGRNTGLIDLGMDDDQAIGSDFSDHIFGSSNNDIIHGGLGDDHLDGGSDSDQLFGGAGDDLLVGSFGRDRVEGGAGDDVIQGDWSYDVEGWNGDDLLFGGEGDDRIAGGQDNDVIDGGLGRDTAIFRGLRSGYSIATTGGVTTIAGRDGTDVLTGIEVLQFTDGLFDLQGRLVERLADTRPAADNLSGTPEDDIIAAGGGDDVITPGLGNDVIDGGTGWDIVHLAGPRSQYTLLAVGDDFLIKGSSGSVHLANVEVVRFSDGKELDLAKMFSPVPAKPSADGSDPEVLPDQLDSFVVSKSGAGPQVLPRASDDTFDASGDIDAPLVLLGPSKEIDTFLDRALFEMSRAGLFDLWSSSMPTLDEQGLVRDRHGPSGWDF